MARIATGAKAVVFLDGSLLFLASGITITHENRLDETPQLDSLEVAEYGEIGHRVSFTVNTFKKASIGSFDQFAGSLNGIIPGIDSTDIREILLLPELLFQVVDKTTGATLYEISGVKFEGGSGAFDARGLWLGSWNFKGKRGRGI